MINHEKHKRVKWKTGRIMELQLVTDGKAGRVKVLIAYKLKGKKSTPITRDIKCLYPLEAHA